MDQCFFCILEIIIPGNDHQLYVWIFFFDLMHQFDSVHKGHPDIGKHDIYIVIFQKFQYIQSI